MNIFLNKFLNVKAEDRRELFIIAASRLGIPYQNIEKDFWVCFVLDILFNSPNNKNPRLLFKGGTSLSKAYGLISRFSEDIDITIFREDLNLNISIDELELMTGKQQRKYFEKIRSVSSEYLCNNLLMYIQKTFDDVFESSVVKPRVVIDNADKTQQTLLIYYPSIFGQVAYIQPSVKIESGAKSALDPHQKVEIHPYISDDLPDWNLAVPDVTTINPERTFWDKIVILHGVNRWFQITGSGDISGVIRHLWKVKLSVFSTDCAF